MGRYAKNRELRSASYSIRLPVGSSAIGPNDPVDGLIRYNFILARPEVYFRNKWRPIGTGSDIEYPYKDTFYGNGSQTVFTPMRFSYPAGNELYIFVFIHNVFQNPGVSYVVNNYDLVFTSPPPDGHPVVVLHGLVTGDYSEPIPAYWTNYFTNSFSPGYSIVATDDYTGGDINDVAAGQILRFDVSTFNQSETIYYTVESV